MKRLIGTLAILLILTAIFVTPHALAAGDVQECNETSLLLALNGGGLVKFKCSGTIVLSDELSIQNDTIFDGTGQDVQITTEGKSRIMQIIREELKVTILGMTFQGGLARTSGGGAILNRANLTIENSKFVDNHVETGIGGAIHNDGGTLILRDTEFTQNMADTGGSGGAVANSNAGVLLIEGGSFNANEATSPTNGRGGAIYGISGRGTITITDTQLNDNIAHGNTEGGGAIYDDGPSEIIIEAAVFSYNSAPNANGGAIYNKGVTSTTSIRDTRFAHNTAPNGQGGALYAAASSEIAIGHSSFESNSAQMGGGLYISSPHNTIVVVSESTFNENSATHVNLETSYGGGAISSDGTLTITRSTFTNNTAPDGSGGAINANLSTFIVNSTMTHNSGLEGGAIHVGESGALKISHSTIVHNSTTPGRGAGIDSGNSVSAAVEVKNSIVADSSIGMNCYTQVLQAFGTNFDTDGSCSGFQEVTSADLDLADLANNRGQTESIAIDVRSVAVDAARDCTDLNNEPVEVDQRGVPRDQGEACDVGAYERIDNPAMLNIIELGEPVTVHVKGEYAVPFTCGERVEESDEYPFDVSYDTEIEIVFPERDKFLGIFPRPQLTAQFIESIGVTEIGVDMPETDGPVGLMSHIKSGQSLTLSCADIVGMPTQVNAQGTVIQTLNELIESGDFLAGMLGIQSDRTELRIFVTEKVHRTEILPPDAIFPPLDPESIEEVTPIYPEFVQYDETAELQVTHTINDVTSAGLLAAQSPTEVRFSTQSFHGSLVFQAQSATTSELGVEIYSLQGERIFAEQRAGQSLMWRMRDQYGQRVANGVYLYVVSALDSHGNVTRSGVKKIAVLR